MSTEPVDTGGDIVVTDKELFDHAVSDTPATTPEPAPPAEAKAPEPAPAPPAGPGRDEQGRFAPKPPQQAATTQRPAPQPPPTQPPAQQPRPQTEDHRVPLATLMQERDRAYRAEAELQQMRQAWAQHQQALQQQVAPAQGQPPQTIFDDPDNYLNARVMNPLRQEGYTMMLQMKDGLSREMANQSYGQQVVDAALNDLQKIRRTPQGEFIFRQIMESGHPYGALVQWQRTARAQQAIGSDPNAWLRKQQEAWLNNPQVQAEVIKRVRGQQQQSGRPSNVQLPPSLSSLPASSGRLDDQGDLSDSSLYKFATK